MVQTQKEKTKKTNLKNKFLTFKNLNKALLVVIIFSGVYYLAGVNKLSIQGFELWDLKDKKSQLVTKNNNLELKIMSLSSYNDINNRVGKLKMVAVGEIDYLSADTSVMAKK